MTPLVAARPPFALLAPAFAGAGRDRPWLLFENPVAVFLAATADEVEAVLSAAERSAREGYHAVGFLSYEAAPGLSPELTTQAGGDLPLAWFAAYDEPRPAATPRGGQSAADSTAWQPSIDGTEYARTLGRILASIERGETYQVNFTYRLRATAGEEPQALFARMADAQQGCYGAYLELDRDVLCSASPELFFELRDGVLRAEPMKGTMPRGRTLAEDRVLKEQLTASIKDRAENLMIVDMVRNDLGRVARAGSVRCPALFEIASYPTVHQMTSTVTAETDASLLEIVRALFPCASITGAPKVRTMQRIRELECSPRGIYTGAVGYLAPGGRDATFSVAIRTAHLDRRRDLVEYGTGGGITWDSGPEAELDESRAKSAILSGRFEPPALFETLAWTPQGGYLLLERHLQRLAASAERFGWQADPTSWRAALGRRERRALGDPRPLRIRLRLEADGRFSIETSPLELERRPWRVAWSAQPVDADDLRLHHKTADREPYARALASRPGFDDVLLYNRDGEVTESTVANLVLVSNGRLLTPRWQAGLLAGTLRQELLERGILSEAEVRRTAVEQADGLFLINSVRGWIPIELVDPV